MKVAVYYSNTDIRIEDKPIPSAGRGEIVVKIYASGICGSDVMEWYRKPRAPFVPGHEVAGEIVEVGDGVEKYRVGQRVVLAHHVPCNTCRYCISGHHTVCETLRKTNFDPGGFAEYVRMPSINVDRGVFLLPDHVSYEEGTLVEPLACVLRGQRIAGVGPGKSVLVVGSGISGLLHVKLARAMGAGPIIACDVSRERIEYARKFGADAVFHADELTPEKVKSINGGYLSEVVILCTGARSAFFKALECLERGGTLLMFATPDPGSEVSISLGDIFWRSEKTITSSYGAGPGEYAEALHLISTGRVPVKDMITHILPLEEIQRGFELVVKGGEAIKVVITPSK